MYQNISIQFFLVSHNSIRYQVHQYRILRQTLSIIFSNILGSRHNRLTRLVFIRTVSTFLLKLMNRNRLSFSQRKVFAIVIFQDLWNVSKRSLVNNKSQCMECEAKLWFISVLLSSFEERFLFFCVSTCRQFEIQVSYLTAVKIRDANGIYLSIQQLKDAGYFRNYFDN